MQKQAPSIGRLFIMVAFALSCFGLLLFLWLAFGGPIPLKPNSYQFKTSFTEATQLAVEADVRISGVPVGKVKKIEPEGGRTTATIEMDRKFAPVRLDSKAILRQKTLLGETYVELTPGSPAAKTVPEGGTLSNSEVSETVELDEIFRAFDAKTRRSFQTWMQSLSQSVDGRGQSINEAFGQLAPFAEDTNELLKILNAESGAVRSLVSNTGTVFSALTERQGQLRSLIQNSNAVFRTTAARNAELQQTFVALPTFQREATLTVNRLTEFARDTDPLITQLRPAARELSPTLTDLSRLAPDLRLLFRDLNPLIDASVAGFPAAERILRDLRPVIGRLEPFLRELNPPLENLGLYRNELRSFFANVPAATQSTTPNGIHYLRTTNPLNPENLAVYPRRLSTNRPNPYQFPRSFDQLAGGLPVYENRQCDGSSVPVLGAPVAGVPLLGVPVPGLIDQSVLNNVNQFAFGGAPPSAVPAPPCRLQGLFPQIGAPGPPTRYPHITAEPPR